jgi:hypothetical protein
VLNPLALLGGEVVPALRKEFESRRDPGSPSDPPTHASRVAAKYGDGPVRQPRPNADRGDNLTNGGPYQDTAELAAVAAAAEIDAAEAAR